MLGGMRHRLLRAALLAATVTALATGCGSAPDTIGPTGVDGLVIPTPTPDPADFVAGIDNPYLPLREGATWGYAVSGDPSVRHADVVVRRSSREVAGVPATEVVTVLSDVRGNAVERRTAWYAQDRAGNVWQFGEARAFPGTGRAPVAWRAGADGAQAGLAMAAEPRVGDGYAVGLAPGVAEDRALVVSVTDTEAGAGRTFTGVLRTRGTSGLEPAVVVQRWYASGVGLIRELSGSGATWSLERLPQS